uniref:Navitripenicin n=1 Tax=Nasonia vitripennis TaxID=7425 RepID=G3M5H1_NASVI|nr:navitripenicin [Nasonia vitripennis]
MVAFSSAASIDHSVEQQSIADHSEEQIIYVDGVPVNEIVRRTLRSGNGKITFEVKNEGGQTSFTVNGEAKVWSSKNGYVSVTGGVHQPIGGDAKGHVGVKGEFEWRK